MRVEQGAAAGDRGRPAGDRTSDSIVPNGVRGAYRQHSRSAERPKPKVTWKSRINLTLGYDADNAERPGHRRTRSAAGWRTPAVSSVQLRPGVDGRGPEPGGPEGLDGDRARLAAALPRRAAASRRVDRRDDRDRVSRRPPTASTADQLLAALQKQAAVDLIVLPISQSDEHLYLRRGVEIVRRLVRSWLAAWTLRYQQWLSSPSSPGVRRGPLEAGSGSP